MNNDQYLAALKRALSGMDKASREEILREIQSHIEELGEGESLRDRFGPAEELAANYLEGEPLPKPLSAKAAGVGKKVLMGFGVLALLLIITPFLVFWLFSGDDFNYADESASELQLSSSAWRSMDWSGPLALNIDQAQAVLYWHDDARLSWHCESRNPIEPSASESLQLRHARCLIYLPAQAVEMNLSQAEVVLVRPRADVQVTMEEASLRIAENGASYRYRLDLRRSRSDEFQSHEGAPAVIAVNANASSIEAYEYR